MKNLILGIAIAASSLIACTNNKVADTKQTQVKNDAPIVSTKHKAPDTNITPATVVFPAKEIIAEYLQLKNTLAKDNVKDASTAGNAIVVALSTVDL